MAFTGARCQGKARRSGKRCLSPAIKGRKYCRLHGGKIPAGKDSHKYKHGLYSKAFSVEEIEAVRENKEAEILQDEIDVLKVQLRRLVDAQRRADRLQMVTSRISVTESEKDGTSKTVVKERRDFSYEMSILTRQISTLMRTKAEIERLQTGENEDLDNRFLELASLMDENPEI